MEVRVRPEAVQQKRRRFGRIGRPRKSMRIDEDLVATVSLRARRGAGHAIERTWETSAFSLKMLGKMVTARSPEKPERAGDDRRLRGHRAAGDRCVRRNFLALISISLGVLNLLPIPLLEGDTCSTMSSRFSKQPVSERAMNWVSAWAHAAPLPMAFAIYNDFNALFAG